MVAGKITLSIVVAIALLTVGCHSDHSGPVAPVQVQSPTKINLYATNTTVDPRLFVYLTGLTDQPITIPVAVDTGSAGLTLDARRLGLPSSTLDETGFIFPDGQSSIMYGGMTITNVKASRSYGGSGGRTETGNVAFAEVAFGDPDGILKTRMMPFLLYYQDIETDSQAAATPLPQAGWFGINSAGGVLTLPISDPNYIGTPVPPAGTNFPECATGTATPCEVGSVLDYLAYDPGVRAGFMLTLATLQDCDVVAGTCQPQPILTVGLNDSIEQGFTLWNLTCPASGFPGPTPLAGYTSCGPSIPNTTLTISGSTPGILTGPAVFDSGTPYILARVIQTSEFPKTVAANEAATVMTSQGLTYTYTYTTGGPGSIYDTVVTVTSSREILVGLPFFTTNSMFIDLEKGVEGWR
jgi:hypothetical protein